MFSQEERPVQRCVKSLPRVPTGGTGLPNHPGPSSLMIIIGCRCVLEHVGSHLRGTDSDKFPPIPLSIFGDFGGTE